MVAEYPDLQIDPRDLLSDNCYDYLLQLRRKREPDAVTWIVHFCVDVFDGEERLVYRFNSLNRAFSFAAHYLNMARIHFDFIQPCAVQSFSFLSQKKTVAKIVNHRRDGEDVSSAFLTLHNHSHYQKIQRAIDKTLDQSRGYTDFWKHRPAVPFELNLKAITSVFISNLRARYADLPALKRGQEFDLLARVACFSSAKPMQARDKSRGPQMAACYYVDSTLETSTRMGSEYVKSFDDLTHENLAFHKSYASALAEMNTHLKEADKAGAEIELDLCASPEFCGGITVYIDHQMNNVHKRYIHTIFTADQYPVNPQGSAELIGLTPSAAISSLIKNSEQFFSRTPIEILTSARLFDHPNCKIYEIGDFYILQNGSDRIDFEFIEKINFLDAKPVYLELNNSTVTLREVGGEVNMLITSSGPISNGNVRGQISFGPLSPDERTLIQKLVDSEII